MPSFKFDVILKPHRWKQFHKIQSNLETKAVVLHHHVSIQADSPK